MFWLWMTISCGIVGMVVIDIFDICIHVMLCSGNCLIMMKVGAIWLWLLDIDDEVEDGG